MINAVWKTKLKLNTKNLIGWSTDRKIIVFSVDDYGNVRLDSKEARKKLDEKNVTPKSPFRGFDLYDSLETKEDLELLFEVLSSVKDVNGKHAVFTPFAVLCNPNFEEIQKLNYQKYVYELLPQTYSKLEYFQPEAYKGAWALWKEGIDRGFFVPQFHGREHFNLKMIENKLEEKDEELLTSLKNRSMARISNSRYFLSISSAFGFWDFKENAHLKSIIEDGLSNFSEVFGYKASQFMAPGEWEHSALHQTLKENGIKYIDTPMIKKEHQGKGKYKRRFNYTGKHNEVGQIFIVRNVVFEPTQKRNFNWVSFAMKQIEAAFRWNRPAIVSSHRVNFCGHIDKNNRKKGLRALQELLDKITERWPEVEFMAANELGKLIASDH